jgi:hypothetical protein
MHERPIRSVTALLAAIATAALLASAPASAGDRGHGYYGYGKYGHSYGRYRGYHHPRYYHPRKYGRHHYHGGNDGAYLLGGIVIGSILTHALIAPPAPTVYAPPRRVVYEGAPVSRRLFRDIDGNCFERRNDSVGGELLIELPPQECAW